MDLNQFMKEVHENAVAHGWWDKPRTVATIRSLLHCELSEAMEAHRKDEPLHYIQNNGKPDGVAVELLDCCIRVLDFFAKENLPFLSGDPNELMLNAVDAYEPDEDSGIENILECDVPTFVDEMHTFIALYSLEKDVIFLEELFGLCFAWIKHRGLDPVKLMIEKHEYNKTRSYMHGGKVC